MTANLLLLDVSGDGKQEIAIASQVERSAKANVHLALIVVVVAERCRQFAVRELGWL